MSTLYTFIAFFGCLAAYYTGWNRGYREFDRLNEKEAEEKIEADVKAKEVEDEGVFKIKVRYVLKDYVDSFYKTLIFDNPTTTGREIFDKMNFAYIKHTLYYIVKDSFGAKMILVEDLDKAIDLKEVEGITIYPKLEWKIMLDEKLKKTKNLNLLQGGQK